MLRSFTYDIMGDISCINYNTDGQPKTCASTIFLPSHANSENICLHFLKITLVEKEKVMLPLCNNKEITRNAIMGQCQICLNQTG